MPRVLGGDEVCAFQNFERAQRDVAEISDGRCDEVEHRRDDER
jgi:hypothetical protein